MKHPGKWTGLYRSGALALVCAALIGLGACSGSDGLTKAEEDDLKKQAEELDKANKELEAEAERKRQEAAEAERKRKEAEAQAAEEERKRLEAEAAAAEEERKRKEAEAAAAEEERKRKEAEAAEAEEERKRLEAEKDKKAAEDAKDKAEKDKKAADDAKKAAEAEQEQLERQLTEAEQAELRARASAFGAQLDGPEEVQATVSWKRGSKLTFEPAGVTMARGSAAPSVPGGWSSASFTGLSGTSASLVNETVYLYTNIQAPSSRAFWKVHNVEVAAQGSDSLNSDTTNDPKPTAAAQYITNPSDSTKASGVKVSGTYDGVSGTFTCTVDNTCTGDKSGDNKLDLAGLVGAPAGGVRSFAGGDWSFKPGSITSRVKAEDQADQDDAYLYFGAWSSIPDNITGTYNFRYIAGGGAETGGDLSNFNTLEGPATFSGGAVGKYVTQGQVDGQNAKIGTFTATATLKADFGDGSAAGTLSGSITDFKEGGTSLTGWQVTLGSAGNVGVAAPIANAAVATQENGTVANIGGLSVGGSWGAEFYGSDNAVIADRDKYPASKYPVVDLAGVVGWFDATGTGVNDASLSGAFAATPSN